MQKDNYQLLIENLDAFIRKYYANQLIRGLLYTTGLVVFLFVIFNTLEYFYYFSTTVRKIFFYTFLSSVFASLYWWVGKPLIHFFKLGKIITHDQAALIIGNHFGDVKDKLVNILQLNRQSFHLEQKELIEASIKQKSAELKPTIFPSAIDLSKNKKYLRYTLPPLVALLVILLMAPSLIKDSTDRIINNDVTFEKKAPFNFILNSSDLQAVQGGDLPIELKLEGNILPSEVYVDINNFQYKMKKVRNDIYSYSFNNLQRNTEFKFAANGFYSKPFQIEIIQKPSVAEMSLFLDYPDYIERRDESVQNTGDLNVPIGTKASWRISTLNIDKLDFYFHKDKKSSTAQPKSDQAYYFQKKLLYDDLYSIVFGNQRLIQKDSVQYSITIIPDAFPTIGVEKFDDSTTAKVRYYIGEVADDYGVKQVTFNYRIENAQGQFSPHQTQVLRLFNSKGGKFEYIFDAEKFNLAAGEKVSFYFEVADNDQVNGSKKTKSSVMTFAKMSEKEVETLVEQNEEAIKKELQKAREESKKIQEKLKALREKMLQEKDLDWKTQKEFEKLLEQQKEIEKKIEQAKEQFNENQRSENDLKKQDESTQDKKEKLNDIFQQLEKDKTNDLMEKIKELMEKLQKDEAIQQLENSKSESEKQEMQLDRLLELYKKLEVESEFRDQAKKLEELSQKQEKLADETQLKSQDNQNINEKQKDITDQLKEVEQKLDDVLNKNKKLESPLPLDEKDTKDINEIKQDIEQSNDDLKKNDNANSSKSKRNAAKKMKDKASKMQEKMDGAEAEQNAEDERALRQILENLVAMSFDQEALIKNLSGGQTQINTPSYVKLIQHQSKLRNDFKLIDDSLTALANRVFEIQAIVTDKVGEINKHLSRGIDDLEERKIPEATDHQQRIMKNVNDLALMLSESLQNMKNSNPSASCNKPGSKSSKKPGSKPGKKKSGNMPVDKITQGQQKLTEDMKKMAEQRQKGKSPGEKGDTPQGKEGEKMGEGSDGSAKEFGEMAARQAALRKALQDLQKEKHQQGKGSKELQSIIDQMDKTEYDLVNKKLNYETMKRQQEILTKLLDAERADREQEFDEQRKSETAKNMPKTLPPSLQEYLKKKEAETEMIRFVNPGLKPYFKKITENYLDLVQKKTK